MEGTVLIPEIRLSINLNAATIEQVIGRRRKLLTDMGDNMAVEVSAALSGSGFEEASVQMLDELLKEEALGQEVMWYNDENNFQKATSPRVTPLRLLLLWLPLLWLLSLLLWMLLL